MSTGFVDGSTGAFFSVDAFGAILPEPVQDTAGAPAEVLSAGMAGWATSDSPWSHLVDRERYRRVLQGVRSLEPSQIFSSHLPAASGASLDQFLQVLEMLPDAEPFVDPNYEEFGHLVPALSGVPRDGSLTVVGEPLMGSTARPSELDVSGDDFGWPARNSVRVTPHHVRRSGRGNDPERAGIK